MLAQCAWSLTAMRRALGGFPPEVVMLLVVFFAATVVPMAIAAYIKGFNVGLWIMLLMFTGPLAFGLLLLLPAKSEPKSDNDTPPPPGIGFFR